MERDTRSGVPHSVFSLEAVAPSERFDLWRDSINCVFEVDAPKERRKAGFEAEVDAHLVGDLAVVRTRTLAQSWARSPELIARDGMDHFMIQIYETGTMEFSHRGRAQTFRQDALVVFDLAQAMQSRTSDFTNLSLLLPRPVLEPHLKHSVDHHMQVIDARNPLSTLLINHVRTLKNVAGSLTPAQAVEASAASTGLVAACLNASEPETEAQAAGVAFALMVRARQEIERRLGDPELSPAAIARAVGVSRTRLYEMFAAFGGVRAYIRERRLRLAARMLLDRRCADRPVSRIALDCGFVNDSAFSRAFRAQFGVTASDLRADPGRGRADTDIVEMVDRRYEDWIRTLSA